jgi:hypothetical protein
MSIIKRDIIWKDLEMEVEFEYTPEEPMVMYYSDGSGYPGSSEELNVIGVMINDIDFTEYLSEKAFEEISVYLSENRPEEDY